MNMRKVIQLLLLFALLCIVCCSQDPEAVAGGGSDLPEVSGSVYLEDGTLAVDARVRVIPGEYLPGFEAQPDNINKKVVATVQTDDSGTFAVEDVDAGTYYLEILSADSTEITVSQHFEQGESSLFYIDTLVTKPVAGISGTVVSEKRDVESIYLAGTHFFIKPDEDGQFSLSAIPGGEYILCAKLEQPSLPKSGWGFAPEDSSIWILVDSLTLDPGEQKDLGTMYILYDSLLIWEFEGETQNALKGTVYHDSNTTAGTWSPLPMDLVEVEAYRGKSIRLASGTEYTFKIAEGYQDLSKMEAFTFYAKGPAKIRIGFRSQEVQTGEGTFISEPDIPGEWTRISIKPGDIFPIPGSVSDSLGRTWNDVKTGITIISFHVIQGTEILMDDIYFEGMKPEDF
jgi:hypothetical protein